MGMVGTVIAFTVFSQNIEVSKPQESLGADFLPQTLLDPSDKKSIFLDSKDKYVGLYFSASWCGPCRSFTPELIKFRNQHQENFEVVLIGGDGSPKAQSKYMNKYAMPWLAMENQSDAAKTASEKLKVQYIPYLVILDPEGMW